MKYALLTEEDVLKAGMGDEFHLKITDTAKRVFKGLRRIAFLNKLRLTVDLMNRVRAHYREYPETSDDFERWRLKIEALFKESKTRIR
jgi:hypothetical protein